jgi:copper(I)-binding protein
MFPARLLACALLVLAPSAAAAAAHPAKPIEVRQPWSRPSAGPTGVGYMVLVNHGARPDALVKAESPLAAKVEAHRAAMAGGIMSMTAQARVAIPAGGQVAFAPGGDHLMFVGLKRPLKAGDRLPATLIFASGQRVAVRFAVGSGAAPPAGGMDAGGMDHAHGMGHSVAAPRAVAERPQLVTKK